MKELYYTKDGRTHRLCNRYKKDYGFQTELLERIVEEASKPTTLLPGVSNSI